MACKNLTNAPIWAENKIHNFMKRTLLPLVALLFLTSLGLHAQRKSDLVDRISELETTLRATNDSLAVAKREANTNRSKAELLTKENQEVRDANATLLENLNRFSQLTKQSSENLNRTIETLNAKERQTKAVNEAITSNDSTAVALLSRAKAKLGDGINTNVDNGSIVFTGGLAKLFGKETATKLSPAGVEWVSKIAAFYKENPAGVLVVEALNITGEFDVSFSQASAIAVALWKDNQVPAEKILVKAKDGNFSEGISLKIAPDYQQFYGLVKETVN